MTKDDKKPSALDSALASLRANAPAEKPKDDSVDKALAGLKAAAPKEAEKKDKTGDVLAGLAKAAPKDSPKDASAADVLAGIQRVEEGEAADKTDDVLAGISAPEPAEVEDKTDEILSGIEAAPEVVAADSTSDVLSGIERIKETADTDTTDDILASVEAVATSAEPDVSDDVLAGIERVADAEAQDTTDDVLAGIEAVSEVADADSADDVLAAIPEAAEAADDEGLDDILAGLEAAEDSDDDEDALDDVLAGLDAPEGSDEDDGSDDVLAALADASEEESDDADDLDDLLADLGGDDEAAGDDGDDVLADLDDSADEAADDDLDALLGDLDSEDEVGDISELTEETAEAEPKAEPQSPFGLISVERPERKDLHRPKFRMALFGDFTGRSSRGVVEVGDALAARKAILLDVDTVEDVIERFATTLTLPIGKDGMGIEVKLKELDDLHPDELYENVEIFEALNGLRQQLGVGSMAANAQAQLSEWGKAYGTPVKLPKRSASTSVPANLKLSEFQSLIGDTSGRLAKKSPAEDIIARVVGPHIVKAADEGSAAMLEAVDAALSSAMRLVLHHPDFQAVEAQWRSLDMLARRIETDSSLENVLFDISAEELAVDLAAQEDLSESGLFRLLNDPLDPETGEGGFSALFGLYTFEETPPHAELLARIAQVAQHVDAPFFTAMTPGYLEVPKEDRHPLTAEAWDALQELPEAGYLGLTSPRFLLRLPYGAKTEPCYEFDFEEFTPHEGLSGMLWANPVVLVAILLAATYKKDGKAMNLGSLMSLGDMPFHYVKDRFGDQVALPCTERNLTSAPAQLTLGRGFMPVVWVKGRNEVRLGSFRALGGEEIAGPWSDAAPGKKAPAGSDAAVSMNVALEAADDEDLETDIDGDDDEDLDDLLGDLGGDDDDADG